MNRTPLAIVAAALLLAVGFFALGILSDRGPDASAPHGSDGDSFASLSPGRRSGSADGDRGGDGSRRRLSGSDRDDRTHGAVPGRDGMSSRGAVVIGDERGRDGARAIDSVDRAQRLRDMAGVESGADSLAAKDRIPDGLRPSRGGGDFGGDVVDGEDPNNPPASDSSAPEGKIFDPFSVYDSDRGPDEEPYLVDQVDFLQDDHGVDMGDDSVLTFPTEGNVSGEAGTIHFEFEPDWAGDEASERTLFRIDEPGEWNNRVRLVKDGNYLRYMFFDNTGGEININTPIDSWQPGEAHEITVNWDQEAGKISMFIDGDLMGEKEYPGELILDGKSRFDLGSKGGDGYIGAGGRIKALTAYDRSLTPFDF